VRIPFLRSLVTLLMMISLTISALSLPGCAAALIAGGVVGGYAVAKDMEDGQLIDTKKKANKPENKGWFGGGDSDDND